MSRLRFALLNAAFEDDHTTRNFRRELAADLVEYDVNDNDLPPPVEPETTDVVGEGTIDAAVITGSRSSVYWDEAWIPPLVEWIEQAAHAGLPMLGVCYGHQVLAEALGGRVAGMDETEIGYRTVTHHGDRLFDGIDETFTVFTTHGDTVVELPDGAHPTAENDYGNHGFRWNDCWGVQFHPEYDIETARSVTDGKRDSLGDQRVEQVLAEITEHRFQQASAAKQVFDNFTDHVRRRQPAPASD